jgi:hypothetical protein
MANSAVIEEVISFASPIFQEASPIRARRGWSAPASDTVGRILQKVALLRSTRTSRQVGSPRSIHMSVVAMQTHFGRAHRPTEGNRFKLRTRLAPGRVADHEPV